MRKFERECLVCGKKYQFCPNCSDYDNMPRYMTLFCSENCHSIFHTASDYENKILTREQAKAKLEKLDLTNRKKFTGSLKKSIDEIMGNKVVEDKVEEPTKVEISKKEETKPEPAKVEVSKVETQKVEPKKEVEVKPSNFAEQHKNSSIPASVQRSINNFNSMNRNTLKK